MKGNAIPTLAESGLSRRAKNILMKKGYEANSSLQQVDESYSDLIKVNGCGQKTAMEISKTLTKYRRENV